MGGMAEDEQHTDVLTLIDMLSSLLSKDFIDDLSAATGQFLLRLHSHTIARQGF